jgi:hypothetical protein
MISENNVIELGYRGRATVDGAPFLITSGSMENTVSTSYLSGYDMAGTKVKSRIYHAAGVVSHTGSISFDLTKEACGKIKNILRNPRAEKFQVSMFGNDAGWIMSDCVAQTISLNGSPNGLVTGSLSFISDSPANMTYMGEINARDEFSANLIPYWHTGAYLARDWSLSFSLNVTPKHCNGDESKSYGLFGIKAHSPKYLFLGECQYDLSFSCFQRLTRGFTVMLGGGQMFSCDNYAVIGNALNIGGVGDINIFKYSASSHAVNDNEGLTIS